MLLLLLAVAVLQFVRLHWWREPVESGCPAAVCLAICRAGGGLRRLCPWCIRGFRALWHILAFHSFRRSRVFGCFRHSFRRSAGVHSRFAALCGTFPLPTPSEGVGYPAVFATPSEGVRGNVRTSGMRHGVLSGCPGHRGGNLRAAVTDSRCQ